MSREVGDEDLEGGEGCEVSSDVVVEVVVEEVARLRRLAGILVVWKKGQESVGRC